MMRDSANEVLRAIATDGPVSRAQLARDLGLSGPTLTQATKHLLDRGLIVELEQTASTGGRRATLLGLVAEAGPIAFLLNVFVGNRALDHQHERIEFAAFRFEERL